MTSEVMWLGPHSRWIKKTDDTMVAVMVNKVSASHRIFPWPFLHKLLTMHCRSYNSASKFGYDDTPEPVPWRGLCKCAAPVHIGKAMLEQRQSQHFNDFNPSIHALTDTDWRTCQLSSSAQEGSVQISISSLFPRVIMSVVGGKGWKGRAELGEFSIRNNGATPDLTCVTLIHISLSSVCIITTNIIWQRVSTSMWRET